MDWFLTRTAGAIALVVFDPIGTARYACYVDSRKDARIALHQIRSRHRASMSMLEQVSAGRMM